MCIVAFPHVAARHGLARAATGPVPAYLSRCLGQVAFPHASSREYFYCQRWDFHPQRPSQAVHRDVFTLLLSGLPWIQAACLPTHSFLAFLQSRGGKEGGKRGAPAPGIICLIPSRPESLMVERTPGTECTRKKRALEAGRAGWPLASRSQQQAAPPGQRVCRSPRPLIPVMQPSFSSTIREKAPGR